jgi:hypothetical protein
MEAIVVHALEFARDDLAQQLVESSGTRILTGRAVVASSTHANASWLTLRNPNGEPPDTT